MTNNSFITAVYRGDPRPMIAVTTDICWSNERY